MPLSPILKAQSVISLSSHLFRISVSFPLPQFSNFYLSLQFPFIFHLVLWSVCPHIYQPTLSSLFLSISLIQTTSGNEFSPWQWAVYPQEQQQSLARSREGIAFLGSYFTSCLLFMTPQSEVPPTVHLEKKSYNMGCPRSIALWIKMFMSAVLCRSISVIYEQPDNTLHRVRGFFTFQQSVLRRLSPKFWPIWRQNLNFSQVSIICTYTIHLLVSTSWG